MTPVTVEYDNLLTTMPTPINGVEFDPYYLAKSLEERNITLRNVKEPKVSVIFVARNESEWIRKAVESVNSVRNVTPFEVVIFDDSSTDNSVEHMEIDKLLCSNGNAIGPSRARNWGATVSDGEILIFCDGHLKFEDFWIDKLIAPILDNRCDAVNPLISDITITSTRGHGWGFDLKTYEYKWDAQCNDFQYRGGIAGGCVAMRKEVFMNVGMFDKSFTKWGLEDSELSLRLSLSGYRLGVIPTVNVGHFFKESNDYGVDWFSYNYNFLRMAYVNMDDAGYQFVLNRIGGSEADRTNLINVVRSSSKFRKLQCDRIRKVSFRKYLELFGKTLS